MPPSDDGLFPTKTEGAPATEPAKPAVSATKDDVKSAVTEGLNALAPAFDSIANFMERANKNVNAPVPKDSGDAAAGWYTDPAGETKKIVDDSLKTVEQRLLGVLARNQQGTLEKKRTDFDVKHGSGKFNELILPSFSRIYQNLTPEQRADPLAIDSALSIVLGHPEISEKLFDLRVEVEAHKEEAAEKELALAEGPGMMSGGRRRGAGGDKLSALEKDFLTRWNKYAPSEWKQDEKSYLESRGRIVDGSTDEEAWEGAFKAAKGAAA